MPRTRRVAPVFLVLVGCGGQGTPAPHPTDVASASPSGAITASPVESVAPSAAPVASASAAPTSPGTPPVAKCEPTPAHRVEPFEQAGKTNFLTSISTTAGTLEKETRAFESKFGKDVDVDCSLSHIDGELVVLQCLGTAMRPAPKPNGFETLTFTRTADGGWKRASFEDLLPSKDAYAAIDGACKSAYPDGLTKNGFAPGADGAPFVALVQPRPGMIFLGVSGIGSGLDGTGCDLPLERVAPWIGCGPLAPLHKPALLDTSALAKGAASPLGLDTAGFAGLTFTSADPRQKKTVETIQKVVDDWATTYAKAPDRVCEVSLSTSELVAVRCAAYADAPDEKVVEGFIFRTSDGARLPAKALFAKKNNAQSDMTIDCLKPYFQPNDPNAPQIENIPVLKADDFKGFRLTTTTARFEVPLMLRRGKGNPLHREYVACGTTLTKLGTTLADIAAASP